MRLEIEITPALISERLAEDGFAIVPEALSSEVVGNLVEQIERNFEEQGSRSGHALRHLIQTIPAARAVAEGPAVRALIEPVLGSGAFVARSLLFDKTPDANWKVAWHQDLTIAVRERVEVAGFDAWSVKDGVAHVQPPTSVLEHMLTVRLHLDDCDSSKGPLMVIPGSHKSGRLEHFH